MTRCARARSNNRYNPRLVSLVGIFMRTPGYLAATVVAAVSLAVSMAVAAAPRADELPTLLDQFGEPVGLDVGTAAVQVAIVVSAKRLRRIKPWEKALRLEFPDLVVVRIADVPRSSPTQYDKVAEKLRKRLPEDVSVGIDLEGQWAEALGLDTSVPNILLFDSTGELVYQQSGMFKKSRFPSLQSALIEAQSTERIAAVN